MRKLFAIGLLGVSLTQAAFAGEELDLNIDPGDLETLAHLPAISDVSIAIDEGPAIAAVQPVVSVRFSDVSCRTFTFSVKTLDTASAFLVAVDRKPQPDCHGPQSKKTYDIQIASDMIYKPIIVLNPVALPAPQTLGIDPVLPRMCTAEAGILFNPETGKCVGYTNGCQRNDMLAKGFQAVQAGQCRR